MQHIAWVQDALNRVMGAGLVVDGIFGPRTRAAVVAFQHRAGLVPDGIPGPITDAALRSALGAAPGPRARAGSGDPCAAIGNPEVLDRFPFAEHSLQSFHHEALIRIARCILARRAGPAPVRTVTLVGHTDPVGTDADNVALGQRRANEVQRGLVATLERMSPGSSRGIAFIPLSKGETEPLSRADLSRRVEVFARAPVLRSPPIRRPVSTVHDVKVVAKSYIALIAGRIGVPTCVFPIPLPPPAPLTSLERLAALSVATDIAFHEDPRTDVKDKVYRLFSARTFRVTCTGNTITNVVPSAIDTDTGMEGPLQTPALTIIGSTAGMAGSMFRFSWQGMGQPHPAALPAFDLVCLRTSIFIWHIVQGEIECGPSGPVVRVTLSGSAFPTHRVWVNGRIVHKIPQGPFRNLWVPHPSNPRMVA